MKIQFTLNGKKYEQEIRPDLLLIDLVRSLGCYSVKRGCETSNCGLCTVWLDGQPTLSCSILAARADGRTVTTLEGLQEEAAEFGAFIADQGAEQCGFCNPGFMMNALALFRDNENPSEQEIREYLAGNLCRCSGYEGQLRGMMNFMEWRKARGKAESEDDAESGSSAGEASGKIAAKMQCSNAEKASAVLLTSSISDRSVLNRTVNDETISDRAAARLASGASVTEQVRRISSDAAPQTHHEKETAQLLRTVNKAVRKKDAMQLLTGQPVYTDDLAPEDCLIVKVLRSPHANALIERVDTANAMKVPGVEVIYTWEDIPADAKRFTCAGQTYPEASPHDRLLLDRHVRYVGDPVAIVAGETEKAVDRALALIKVTYQVLTPVLDYHTALDNPVLVHPEDNWESLCPVGADNRRNLCAHDESRGGDIDKVLSECDIVLDRTYHTKAAQQTMMETFRVFCTIDAYGRLHVTSSTQIVFHCRRIVAAALGIPQSKVRVTKPRIGGGFGAKQTVVAEIFPAFVTWKTKKPSKMIYTREECMTASTPRHEMEMHVRLGAMRDGRIRGIDLYTISNTGAYGDHGPTTVGLSGHKSIPLYGKAEAFRFVSDVVYTNIMAAGAYRGYGATQGLFAVESAVNELAAELHMDPFALREMNIVREGDVMPAYYDEPNTSCALDKCLARVKKMSGWAEKFPVRRLPNGKIRAMGMGMAMQGSCISGMDVGSATLKANEEGYYTLTIGAADMGTGCDTILAQIAAQVLECPVDAVTVFGADTDASPYDSGSYASSTTFVTGKAVEKCAQDLRERICRLGAKLLGCEKEQVEFDGTKVYVLEEEGAADAAAVRDSDTDYNAKAVNDVGTVCVAEVMHGADVISDCSVNAVRSEDVSCGTDAAYGANSADISGVAEAERKAECLENGEVGLTGVSAEKQESDNQPRSVSLQDIVIASMCGNDIALETTYTHSSMVSPPPYMVGAAEIEVDPQTGHVEVVDFYAAVDCGTPINPNLARVQAEGGIVQGIGMALSENISYSADGHVHENSLMQYKIPARTDFGHIHVAFENSYEDGGPFGAKSIGEIVINTPLPSIADAVYQATGKRFYELPILPGQVAEE